MQFFFVGYPYVKVTGSVSVCLCVPKDLGNRCNDMVLLNIVVFYKIKVVQFLSNLAYTDGGG